MNVNSPDPSILTDIVKTKMPFGKYKNVLICDLPENYLEWFKSAGFPQGRLGMMLSTMYEIRLNGLTDLLSQLKKIHRNP
ncbi:MAG: DUF3820 family protein [Imperialibacter sp.]|uniref:DUF3820 family protein n=1 Tax=Imperialibacter sp. TaxID=2038411 RepID=UPI0030DDA89F